MAGLITLGKEGMETLVTGELWGWRLSAWLLCVTPQEPSLELTQCD